MCNGIQIKDLQLGLYRESIVDNAREMTVFVIKAEAYQETTLVVYLTISKSITHTMILFVKQLVISMYALE